MREHNGRWTLDLPDLIQMNQLVRGRIDFWAFDRWYDSLPPAQRIALTGVLYDLAGQAGVNDSVLTEALERSKLPAEHAVVPLLFDHHRGERRYLFDVRQVLTPLGETDLRAAFRLCAALFGTAEGRVCTRETVESCNHWWHRDLLDRRVVTDLLNDPQYFRTSMRDDDRLKARLTEHDWLSANDADRMLEFIYGRTTPGKFRLAYGTVFRQHWGYLTADRSSDATQTVTGTMPLQPGGVYTGGMSLQVINHIGRRCRRFVDHHAGEPLEEKARVELHREALTITEPNLRECVTALVMPDDELEAAVRAGMRHMGHSSGWPTDGYLMRELFGNPFRPIALEPTWFTSDVIAVAQGIRRDRAFDGMPVLADALQEAGCTVAALLDHLRDGCLFTVSEDVWRGSHLPGCWALDLVLEAISHLGTAPPG